MSTSSHEQFRKGFWWYKLMPKVTEKYCEMTPDVDRCVALMRDAGFVVDVDEIVVPLQASLMAPDAYFKYGLEGVFKKDFRDGDSAFSMGGRIGELATAQAEVRKIQEAGKEADWIAAAEADRKTVGQATIVTARKPA